MNNREINDRGSRNRMADRSVPTLRQKRTRSMPRRVAIARATSSGPVEAKNA